MRLHRNEVFTVQFLIIVSMYRGSTKLILGILHKIFRIQIDIIEEKCDLIITQQNSEHFYYLGQC